MRQSQFMSRQKIIYIVYKNRVRNYEVMMKRNYNKRSLETFFKYLGLTRSNIICILDPTKPPVLTP